MRSEARSGWPVVMVVAATYVVFLLFAQFAFLDLLQSRLDAGGVRGAMAAMGVAGLAASLVAGLQVTRQGPRRLMRLGFVLAAVIAALAPALEGLGALTAAAAAIGAVVGVLTVSVATALPSVLGRGAGVRIGLGTGLAYLVCNLPGLFDATENLRCWFVAVIALAGAIAAQWMVPGVPPGGEWSSRRPVGRGAFLALGLAFLALVWFDSAAFAVVQDTERLRAVTWSGPGRQLVQGLVHLIAALAAGWALDRGRLRTLLVVAWCAFAVAFHSLASSAPAAWAGPLYAVGISLYSTALVAAPGLLEVARIGRAWRAALLFGIAGWVGSALGVGMAQDLHRVPAAFVVASGLVVLAGAVATSGRLRRAAAGLLVPAAAAAASMVAQESPPAVGPPPAGGLVAAGRRVYVAEGCIHCHSQYVRPGAGDPARYGTHRPLDRSQQPPLVGSRRQGPDLSSAGLRHDARWHRAHLIDPRALAPHSLMPSYEHLFADRSWRGEALVAYLSSLGRTGQGESDS